MFRFSRRVICLSMLEGLSRWAVTVVSLASSDLLFIQIVTLTVRLVPRGYVEYGDGSLITILSSSVVGTEAKETVGSDKAYLRTLRLFIST